MKQIKEFIGRKYELSELNRLLQKKTASLVAIKGRRRVGKSRLIQEFSQKHKRLEFIGLPPDEQTTAQTQRDNFAYQLHQQTGLPQIKTDDWSELFTLLSERTKQGQIIVIFDEITWMGSKDPTFLGKLYAAWERFYKKNPKLILILCGSISSWIEKNILSSTGYFGRVTLQITLDELPLGNCNKLLEYYQFKRSAYEKLMFLSVTGGIPWYIEHIDANFSAEENIKHLCFMKDALLVNEFEKIFHDLFKEKRRKVCKDIVTFLAKQPGSYQQISKGINYPSSGSLSEYLEELTETGFIQHYYSWQIKTGEMSALSQYRLKDNYLRFYLKCIKSKLNQIDKKRFLDMRLSELPGWGASMGLQFENLVLNNRNLILKDLNITPDLIINDDPFFQPKTSKQKGCQIDYLIQTKYKTLFVCEIKFSLNDLNSKVIQSIKDKINALSLPRGYACVPVLIHANGVSEQVLESGYFGKIINACDWLEDEES